MSGSPTKTSGAPQDPRLSALLGLLLRAGPSGRFPHEVARDPLGTGQLELNALQHGAIRIGRVTQPIPHANCYRVQLSAGPVVLAYALTGGSTVPLGPRAIDLIPANSEVLLWFCPEALIQIILGPLPPFITDGNASMSDWLMQGAISGLKTSPVHNAAIKQLERGGGIQDFSAGRPLDGTQFDRGWITETGLRLLISPFEIQAAVNEACGLFLNLRDSHTLLAGMQLKLRSFAMHLDAMNDEGELQGYFGASLYPEESLGLYQPTNFFQENDTTESQYTSIRGRFDLAQGDEDLQPIHRLQRYWGYLGQGEVTWLMKPAKEDGKRHYADTDPDYGLYLKSIAAEGSLLEVSARQAVFGRRPWNPVPKRIKPPEDQKDGDDARKGNYLFSGRDGGGDEHRIEDIQHATVNQALQRVASVDDALAYQANWQTLHPFAMHKQDFKVAEESALTKIGPYTLPKFGTLAEKDILEPPEPKKLKIDDRYNEVEVTPNANYLDCLPDGSNVLLDGYGSRIAQMGAKIQIDAAGAVHIFSGKIITLNAPQVIINGRDAVDISSAHGPVHVKSETDTQILAGNGGTGALLLESKGAGSQQQYRGKFGEDVKGNGIVFKSAGVIAGIGQDIYLRTNGGRGAISLDANKGSGDVLVYSRKTSLYAQQSVDVWHAPSGESSNITASYSFSPNGAIFTKNVNLRGSLLIGGTGAQILIDGGLNCTGGIIAGTNISNRSGSVGKVPPEVIEGIRDGLSQIQTQAQALDERGTVTHRAFVSLWYNPSALGADTQIEAIGFSFRDPPENGKQYRTEELSLLEPRWIQMARLGGGGSGEAWDEKPVDSQGTSTYPWPGRSRWQSRGLLRLSAHTLHDAATGQSKDRGPGSAYESPKLGDLTEVGLNEGLKVL